MTTSLERVLTTLGHQEPDRVPQFLLLTIHGAKELGMTIPEYFSRAEHVVEGQLRLRKKYRNDCLYTFFYAPVEIEAWGGEVIFREDGPANSGDPFLKNFAQIASLTPPDPYTSPSLKKVLEATALLKEKVGADAPIIGVVMSPFSVPVMQLGFDRYIELMYERPDLFEKLMRVNEEFCVSYANAQLKAGATAICYFDPVSSPTIIPPEIYRRTGHMVANRAFARIEGPTATHFASGCAYQIIGDILSTSTAVVGVSADEDLAKLKERCKGRVTILGNLNGIEMRRWTPAEAEEKVKKAIREAGAGGGFILADNHGEIPFQVPEETLLAISEAVHEWGRYPLAFGDG